MEDNNNDKLKMHERMAVVETQVKNIVTNHLPHILGEIKYVKKRINWLIGIFVLGLISVIGLLIRLI